MPLKTWVEYERLEAADLNGAFAWSQELTLPGAWSATAGATLGTIVAGAYGVPALGAPAAGGDPLGIWQSDGKLLIPAGWGGIWALNLSGYCNPVTTGNAYRIHITGMGTGARSAPIGGGTDGTSGSSDSAWHAAVTMPAVAGASIFPEIRAPGSDYTAGMVLGWSIMRLGRGLGIPGSVGVMSLLAVGLPGIETLPSPAEDEA